MAVDLLFVQVRRSRYLFRGQHRRKKGIQDGYTDMSTRNGLSPNTCLMSNGEQLPDALSSTVGELDSCLPGQSTGCA